MLKKAQFYFIFLSALSWIAPAYAFDSGSNGVDGRFSPTTNTTLTLPENGILNFTDFNIPSGVTVKFIPNQLNTPAYILVSGNAQIDGVLNLNGVNGTSLGQDFEPLPPGGFAGGQRVYPGATGSSNGLGPGGGRGGKLLSSVGCGGYGASYAAAGLTTNMRSDCIDTVNIAMAYGSESLQPLIGGSGGGGGSNISETEISGAGGSGGGALLLAVSGTLTLNGTITANGGSGESYNHRDVGAGGGGSGGAVRIVATEFSGQGSINVLGGAGGISNATSYGYAAPGNFGRIRTEFEHSTFTGRFRPAAARTHALPSTLFFANMPSIRITHIAGQAVPQVPTGENDIILPTNTPNPVHIEIASSQVTLGEVVKIKVTSKVGDVATVDTTPLTGTINNATAGADVNLPLGASVITASISFTVTTAQSEVLAKYTQGEPVKQVTLSATPGQEATMQILTASGKHYFWPQKVKQQLN